SSSSSVTLFPASAAAAESRSSSGPEGPESCLGASLAAPSSDAAARLTIFNVLVLLPPYSLPSAAAATASAAAAADAASDSEASTAATISSSSSFCSPYAAPRTNSWIDSTHCPLTGGCKTRRSPHQSHSPPPSLSLPWAPHLPTL